MAGRLRRLAAAPAIYARTAWWGLAAPRLRERGPLVVHQGVVLRDARLLLTVRSDLQGWELPGGNALPGESGPEALEREILEETGVRVAVERVVGEYHRTGFRPHVAWVYACRAVSGEPRPSSETPRVRWFPLDAVPGTLFPWYRRPLRDALARLPEPVVRREHWGVAEILQGFWIDLRMRLTDLRAG